MADAETDTKKDAVEQPEEIPVITLTPEQVNLIVLSWDCKPNELSQRGVDIFVRFFESHPIYKSYFKQFRDVEMQEMKDSPKLRMHSGIVMRSICELVECLGNRYATRTLSVKLVQPHFDRGVRPSQYRELFTIIVDFLKDKLGYRFNKETEEAWGILVDYLVTIIRILTDRHYEVQTQSSE